MIIIDLFAIVISFFGAFLLRFDFTIPAEYSSIYWVWLPVFIVIKLAIFSLFGLYKGIWRYTSLWDLINIAKAVFIASIILIVVFGFIEGLEKFPRSIFLLDLILTTIIVCANRVVVRL